METVTLAGRRYVIVPEDEFLRMRGELSGPPLPEPDERGYYPAVATGRAILARKILRRRRAVGLTQADLARAAGIRPETLSRIESGTRCPSVATVDKLDQALREAETADHQRT